MSLRRTFQFALAAVLVAVSLALGSAAGAQENPDYTAPAPSEAVTNSTPRQVRKISTAAPAAPEAAGRQRLAITGSDFTQLLVVGSILLAGGAATLLIRRRNLA